MLDTGSIGRLARRGPTALRIVGAKLEGQARIIAAGSVEVRCYRRKGVNDDRVGNNDPDERPRERPPERSALVGRIDRHISGDVPDAKARYTLCRTSGE